MSGRQIRNGYSEAMPGSSYDDEEEEFLRAMQTYMKERNRRFPSFTEVLAVARSLGYRKVAPPADPATPTTVRQRRRAQKEATSQ